MKKTIEPQKGAKPLSQMGEAIEHMQRIMKYADENGHSEEIVKTLVSHTASQFNLTPEQIATLTCGRVKPDGMGDKF